VGAAGTIFVRRRRAVMRRTPASKSREIGMLFAKPATTAIALLVLTSRLMPNLWARPLATRF
jgi:hypothetical protein